MASCHSRAHGARAALAARSSTTVLSLLTLALVAAGAPGSGGVGAAQSVHLSTASANDGTSGATGGVTPSAPATVLDRTWLWAHPAGFHDNYFTHAPFNATPPGTYRSRITPVEAAMTMGVKNLMFVWEFPKAYAACERGTDATGTSPCYPATAAQLDKYLVPFRSPHFTSTAFSVGGGGVSYPPGWTDAVIDKALASVPSSAGVLFDDFRYDATGLAALSNVSSRVRRAAGGGKDVFLCLYTSELASLGPAGLKPFLELAKRPMLWMANKADIATLPQHWAALEAALDAAGGREAFKPMLGLYMFDYLSGSQEMPPQLMAEQLATALTLLKQGRAHDVIFLGSPIVDLPLAAVTHARQWVAEHGAEPISG